MKQVFVFYVQETRIICYAFAEIHFMQCKFLHNFAKPKPTKPLFKRYFIIVFSLILSAGLNAQNVLQVEGKMKVEEGKLDGTMEVLENGSRKRIGKLSGSGKFDVELEINKDYIFVFSQPGYVTKRIEFDTRVDAGRDNTIPFATFPFQVTLFKQYEGVSYVIFNQPVAKIYYSPEPDDFEYDTDYTKSIRDQLEKVEKEIEEIKKEEEKKLKEQEKAEAEAFKRAQEEAEREEKALIAAEKEEQKKAEEARKEAERKAKEEEEARKQEEERLAKLEEEQKRQQALAAAAAAELAREEEENRAKEEAARQREEDRLAREEEDRKRKETLAAEKAEEDARKEEEKKRADEELARKREEERKAEEAEAAKRRARPVASASTQIKREDPPTKRKTYRPPDPPSTKKPATNVVVLHSYTIGEMGYPNLNAYGYINFGDGTGRREITKEQFDEYAKIYH